MITPALALTSCVLAGCNFNDADFNNDGVIDLLDVTDFISVMAGGPTCRPGNPEETVEPTCFDSIDFDNNGVFPEDFDYQAFIIVWSGAIPC
jgi:hypothetical protein